MQVRLSGETRYIARHTNLDVANAFAREKFRLRDEFTEADPNPTEEQAQRSIELMREACIPLHPNPGFILEEEDRLCRSLSPELQGVNSPSPLGDGI